MEDIVLITPPPIEPITLSDAKLQLGFGPVEDSDRLASQILADKLRAFISAARHACENYTRRVFVTQTWLLRRDSFPGHAFRYQWNGYPQIDLPKPPFQSIQFFQYVDVSGALQTLTQDTTYGVNPQFPQYGYQLDPGSETQAARLIPPFARPWPPTRMVPGNVVIQFRAGYGGPLTVSIEQGSAAVTVQGGYVFNPGDAPLLVGDMGMPVSIPGAGQNGATLNTNIASVDVDGNATLATSASTTVTNVAAWFGKPVPKDILTAIKMLVEFYYDHGGCEDVPLPRVIEILLKPYCNWVA
jgi:hypothetical protein